MTPSHREAPMRRKLPNGKFAWSARCDVSEGKRRYYGPGWNRGSATFPRIDTTSLFATTTGRVWWERNFYRDV